MDNADLAFAVGTKTRYCLFTLTFTSQHYDRSQVVILACCKSCVCAYLCALRNEIDENASCEAASRLYFSSVMIDTNHFPAPVLRRNAEQDS